MKKPFEPTRKEVLRILIDELFAHVSSEAVDSKAAECDEVVTEMFEVTASRKNSIKLMYLFKEEELEPIIFPPRLQLLIRRRDILLLTLGRKDDAWSVLWMGPPYDEL